MKLSGEELLTLVGGFQEAWLILLGRDYVRPDNIEKVPALLVAAILGAASEIPLGESDLAQIALAQLDRLEKEVDLRQRNEGSPR